MRTETRRGRWCRGGVAGRCRRPRGVARRGTEDGLNLALISLFHGALAAQMLLSPKIATTPSAVTYWSRRARTAGRSSQWKVRQMVTKSASHPPAGRNCSALDSRNCSRCPWSGCTELRATCSRSGSMSVPMTSFEAGLESFDDEARSRSDVQEAARAALRCGLDEDGGDIVGDGGAVLSVELDCPLKEGNVVNLRTEIRVGLDGMSRLTRSAARPGSPRESRLLRASRTIVVYRTPSSLLSGCSRSEGQICGDVTGRRPRGGAPRSRRRRAARHRRRCR